MVGLISGHELASAVVNGVTTGTAYGLVGWGFGLILTVTGRFHLAFVVTYELAGYIAASTGNDWVLPFWAALLIGTAAGSVIGPISELTVYRRVERRAGDARLLAIFIASLGLTVIGQGLIAAAWETNPTIEMNDVGLKTFGILGTTISQLNAYYVLIGWVILLGATLALRHTSAGKVIQAVRINPALSRTMGIHPERTYLWVFLVASLVGAMAGVFDAAATAAQPDLGTSAIFYAFFVSFLMGQRCNAVRAGIVGILIAVVQNLASYFSSGEFSSLLIFSLLMAYIIVHTEANQLRSMLLATRQALLGLSRADR